MTIPRIGHEVIVSFLNGNPNQPIVTGRTYDASSMTLQTSLLVYVLTEHKTKVPIRSKRCFPVYIVIDDENSQTGYNSRPKFDLILFASY